MMCTGVTESPLHRTQLESLRLDWDQSQFFVPLFCSKCLSHMDWRIYFFLQGCSRLLVLCRPVPWADSWLVCLPIIQDL